MGQDTLVYRLAPTKPAAARNFAELDCIPYNDPGTHVVPVVAVAQLVEHQIVVLGVAGSSPVSHPERLTAGGCRQIICGRVSRTAEL